MEDIHERRDRVIEKSKDLLRDVITQEGLWDRKRGKNAFRFNGNGYDVFTRHGYPAYKDFNEPDGIAHDTLDLMEMLYPEKPFLERLEMLASMMGEGSIYREHQVTPALSDYAKEAYTLAEPGFCKSREGAPCKRNPALRTPIRAVGEDWIHRGCEALLGLESWQDISM